MIPLNWSLDAKERQGPKQGQEDSVHRRVSMDSSVDGRSHVARDVGGLRDGEWPPGDTEKADCSPSLTTARNRILLPAGTSLGEGSSPGPPEMDAAPADTLNPS